MVKRGPKKIPNIDTKKINIKEKIPRQHLTAGQKAADWVTNYCGSWTFIFLVFVFIAIWMTVNVMMVIYKWDPYPFILLNFILSCMAAVQAPIILMSQNRQAERDRLAAKYDYQVNRRAERENLIMMNDLRAIKRKLNIK
ncbi:DUF1003 domain-containing protein [Candidatus Woesearchaeota archaeon]|nr:DUF1003 domain-containing protein [Candidatus Woesearchaeota archaeon]MBW3018534.1 DUF1003 domain-containing protein [Candidatus Woesearchaeota archaeon]